MDNNRPDPAADKARMIADLSNRLALAESALAKIGALATKASARSNRLSMQAFRDLSPAAKSDFIKSGGQLND